MRTIKFRGKDNHGTWRYGYLVCLENNPAIYFQVGNGEVKRMDWVYVKPESVGQFTGLYDKDSKEIYEGDIIRRPSSNRYYVVKFDMDFFPVFALFYSIGGNIHFADYLKVDYADTYEVVGNIYDNPGLVTNDF